MCYVNEIIRNNEEKISAHVRGKHIHLIGNLHVLCKFSNVLEYDRQIYLKSYVHLFNEKEYAIWGNYTLCWGLKLTFGLTLKRND